MALQLSEMGFSQVFALKGGFMEWINAGFSTESKASLREGCIDCHAKVSPSIVIEWWQSKHSRNEALCSVCHGDQHVSEQDVAKTVMPEMDLCKRCHETQDAHVIKIWAGEFLKTHNPKAR